MEKLIDLSRPEAPHFEDQSPSAWQDVFKTRCLVEGIQFYSDARDYRTIVVDDRVLLMRFKYFGADCALAQLDDLTLLARVSGIWAAWNPHGIPGLGRGQFEEGRRDGDEVDEYPPILFPIRLRDLLSSARVFRREGEYWVGWSELPEPPIFKRVSGEADKQKAATFSPTLSVCLPPSSPTPETEFLRFVVMNTDDRDPNQPREVVFQTDQGGDLRITATSLHGAFHLSVRYQGADRGVLCCRFRLSDSEGRLWEAESLFTPEVFLEWLYDLMAGNVPTTSMEEVHGDPVLSNVRDTVNDGGTRVLVLGSEVLVLRFDWLRLTYDVWALPGEASTGLLVRVDGLTACRFPAHDPGGLYLEVDVSQSESRQEVPVPPLYFPVDPCHLIFRNTTFAVDDGFWHDNDLPIPLVFRRVPGKGTPQPGVEFRPHRQS